MPQLNSNTVLGTQLLGAVGQNSVSNLALWFPNFPIGALFDRKIGELSMIRSVTGQQIEVYNWDVKYPGIWPIFERATPTTNLQFRFTCFRPGLPYTISWG